jgi:hypothetical protein
MIRLRMRNDEMAWKTSEALKEIWEELYSLNPEDQRFPVEPEIRKMENGRMR